MHHHLFLFFLRILHPPSSTLFPYTTLFRSVPGGVEAGPRRGGLEPGGGISSLRDRQDGAFPPGERSEEHTSELQSHHDLVCRLLLEKKKPICSNSAKYRNKQAQPDNIQFLQ